MRYLITTLIVLALASPAMSQCIPNQQVTARSDCGLPDSSAAFAPTDCSTADWVFDFDRTSGTSWTSRPSEICIIIDCLGVKACFSSSDYPPGRSYTIGPYNDQKITDTGQGYLVIYKRGPCGNFANVDLRAYDFND